MEGSEGPRLGHFRMALHKMLQATMKSCRGETITEQCFPFGLTPSQISQLNDALYQQLESLHSTIKGPVEELLHNRQIPEKLNEIDAFLRSQSSLSDEDNKNILPSSVSGRIQASLLPTKQTARHRLYQQVETLCWQNEQRKRELIDRQRALHRRCEHVRDTQQLLEVAWDTIVAGGEAGGQLELLVDRMVCHPQLVPPPPPTNNGSNGNNNNFQL